MTGCLELLFITYNDYLWIANTTQLPPPQWRAKSSISGSTTNVSDNGGESPSFFLSKHVIVYNYNRI